MEDREPSIFERLPMQLKIDIFSLLDRDSRLALQLTSRSNCEAFGFCPHDLKSLHMRGVFDGPEPQFSLKSFIEVPDSGILVNKKRLIMKKAAEEVVKIFKNKNSVVKELKLFAGANMDIFLKCLARTIRAHKREKNCKFSFRVEQIHWIGNIDMECLDFCTLLAYFDPSVLDSIRIENYRMDRLSMIEFLNTVQFQSAKKISVQALLVNIPIQCFLRFNEIDIKVTSVNGKDLFDMVKKFRAEDIPVDSFFCIASDDRIDESIINDVFNRMEIPMGARESISSHTHNHVSKHSCHDPNTVFILKMDSASVYGCIVSNNAEQRTRMEVSVYMHLREMGVDFKDF